MDTDASKTKSDAAGSTEPQKYIRTYAGDMEVVQKGGIPDLAPLVSDKKSEPVSAATPTPTPVEITVPLVTKDIPPPAQVASASNPQSRAPIESQPAEDTTYNGIVLPN
ncbi:hypothetical protein A3G63_01185 [Candidatus Kaiserbacteria bacterium RIFCSPLOWO2_12_FULL_52_8]|uniref:Uncharacterized protein n=1 Tax=Candidatus Kaiserbacteria bacterium RIFCSPHIGHO2_01_FULL_53_31 TaxID=1798481 RepID=A0A1F6CGW1_9BACT|nr:MAG: hypothetical protein A2678_01700 [Candidatus Kaiserbacteria bacterium RIFCSPHIGHO2_01_FULL_53_31]OGG93613.1 MAG: hypothetical protein A3G63_01185 [Candidatus Kaiserbacteria bacterium RIFCSPLOWO2_12_FULL_52_8]